MEDSILFREEVINHRKNQTYGAVFINTPLPYKFVLWAAILIVISIILLLYFGQYANQLKLTGYLNSTKGIIGIYAERPGVIKHCYIKQGAKVQKGDKLFLIDTSFDSLSSGNTLINQHRKRRIQINQEISAKKSQLKRLKSLLEKGYIALITYEEKQNELRTLEQRATLIDLALINAKQANTYLIRAPIDGLVSSLNYKQGQHSNVTKPLTKLLPSDAKLIAELFIPIRQFRFIANNKPIFLQYDAYPFQQFGIAKARINEISHTVLIDEEEDKPLIIGQPYYKAVARLEQQFIWLNGKKKLLRHGMTFTAVVMGPKKKLWQWLISS